MSKDIITEFLELAAQECPTFTEAVAVSIERQLRQRWGGARIEYIAKTTIVEAKAKDEALREARRTGRVREAGEQFGVSRATMYRMLKRSR